MGQPGFGKGASSLLEGIFLTQDSLGLKELLSFWNGAPRLIAEAAARFREGCIQASGASVILPTQDSLSLKEQGARTPPNRGSIV